MLVSTFYNGASTFNYYYYYFNIAYEIVCLPSIIKTQRAHRFDTYVGICLHHSEQYNI